MNKGVYLIVLIALALLMTFVEVLSGVNDAVVDDTTHLLWGFISLVLIALWANADARNRDFEKPFDFGFLIYVLWPVLLPWYLFTTRGLEGLVIFLGILTLMFGPWFAGLVAYVYFS